MRPPTSSLGPTRLVRTEELDVKLVEIAASPEGAAAHFDEFVFDMPIDSGLDPLSAAYRDVVLAHYRRVIGTGAPPASGLEQPDVDPNNPLVIRPWPYNTGSAIQVGYYLQAIGFIIAACQPRPGHRVLQMGIGNLDLAIPLSSMGCAVTVWDSDGHRVAVLRRRAERAGVALRVEQIDIRHDAEAMTGLQADLVIFPATLQYQLDHLLLLRLVRERLLARGGRVVLAGEPLLEAHLTPWGVQQDGASLWSMRHGIGLSLVFRPSYLMQALAACGYTGRLSTCSQTALGNVVIATHAP